MFWLSLTGIITNKFTILIQSRCTTIVAFDVASCWLTYLLHSKFCLPINIHGAVINSAQIILRGVCRCSGQHAGSLSQRFRCESPAWAEYIFFICALSGFTQQCIPSGSIKWYISLLLVKVTTDCRRASPCLQFVWILSVKFNIHIRTMTVIWLTKTNRVIIAVRWKLLSNLNANSILSRLVAW